MSFLISYMSLEQGFTTTVVDAPDADSARQYAVRAFGPPGMQTPMLCQLLDGLPLVYADRSKALHIAQAAVSAS